MALESTKEGSPGPSSAGRGVGPRGSGGAAAATINNAGSDSGVSSNSGGDGGNTYAAAGSHGDADAALSAIDGLRGSRDGSHASRSPPERNAVPLELITFNSLVI